MRIGAAPSTGDPVRHAGEGFRKAMQRLYPPLANAKEYHTKRKMRFLRRSLSHRFTHKELDMRTLVTRSGLAAIASAAWLGLASAAMAAPVSFSVPLTGTQQVPPVQTAGSGKADITYDPATKNVTWSISYDGLSSPATMAHFHGPAAAGANAGVQIWLSKHGDTAVSSPITGHATLTAEQDKQFEAGQWYVNIHTKSHPGGEIRGQVVPPKH